MTIKSLTTENWLEPDSNGLSFIQSLGAPEELASVDWLGLFLRVKLAPAVPDNVRADFEIARGALVYGYFFAPLFALVAKPLARAARCAVYEKCKKLGVQTVYKNGKELHLSQALAWLRHHECITRAELHQWEELFKFADAAAPPKKSLPPADAVVKYFNTVGEKINGLFE
jgi:hypothetical protein